MQDKEINTCNPGNNGKLLPGFTGTGSLFRG